MSLAVHLPFADWIVAGVAMCSPPGPHVMTTLGYIVSATVLVSLISMIGVVFLSLRQETLKKVSADLVAFASGGLIGGAFFHLVPEAYTLAGEKSLSWTVEGILLFFVLEKGLRWRHCHEAGCTRTHSRI